MFKRHFSKLVVTFFLAFSLFFVFSSGVDARRRSCFSKRRACLARCASRARRSLKHCRRRALLHRAACIKKAHRAGKRCLKKQSCPEADACYKYCNTQPDPVQCFEKKECAAKRATCYSSCQIPIGQQLKQCLESTSRKLKSCSTQAANSQSSCQDSCPKCS